MRQNSNRRYTLGSRLIRLGESASRQFGTWARPFLAQLVDQVEETANLAVMDGDEVVYVAQVPSRHSMRMFTEVGRRLLPHGTGVGKAMLSKLPRDEVRALLARTGLPAYTPNTITDPDELLASLDQIAEQGYALDRQERGSRACGASRCRWTARRRSPPCRCPGPDSRLTKEAVARILPEVLGIAKRLSDQAGRA